MATARAPRPWATRASRRASHTHKATRAVGRTRADVDELGVAGVLPLAEICDQFECKSSPAVEATIKAVARDLADLKEGARTLAPFAEQVAFSDGWRSFTGRDGYKRYSYVSENLTGAKGAVTAMRMEELDTCVVEWRVQGTNQAGKVDARVATTLEFNLITGKVLSHSEVWDLSGSDSNAALVFKSGRAAYAMSQAAGDLADKASDALSSFDESEQSSYSVDPTDPRKFFEQEDTFMKDALQFATVVAALWAITKVLATVETLG